MHAYRTPIGPFYLKSNHKADNARPKSTDSEGQADGGSRHLENKRKDEQKLPDGLGDFSTRLG